MTEPYTLILLRHGNSEWNQKNLFTGWVDVPLSEQGVGEAKRAGQLLAESGLTPDVLYTSRLVRAINTANLALAEAGRLWIDVKALVAPQRAPLRCLQGKDKAQTLAEYGPEQFQTWRRSYDVPPPPLADDDEYSQAHDPRYADLGADLPRTECLKDVVERMLPYWFSDITVDLAAGKTVLVTAHGNSLRALGEAPRRHLRRRHRRAEHPHRHPARLQARRGIHTPRASRLPRPRSRRGGCRRRGRAGQKVSGRGGRP